MERGLAAQGPVMKAHFIDVGQANATLLEFQCGIVLIDAGAQDDEHVDGLVDFITSVFDARPELASTLEAVYVTHNVAPCCATPSGQGFQGARLFV